MVARIPYTVTAPKYFAVASEVATMAFTPFLWTAYTRGIRIFAFVG